ncbi:S-adenosyl-L-methionine-dependent methyltransferase [Aspergillus pseudonomiae]|uniref:Velvet complex subunit laeA n=1 Tax=Aspergillus pseudonomiae TaxID=1506151 RepID=A0A5N7DL04_9EURO|nr:S-adenosyl-L-methionine-dependent methyltransferase [Aspergillus pseudonomiae]KAE8407132.1 S-adenosyl-L-methionine-dependent methyltransferase [Aspergillus pseudonomiae]
MVLQAKSSDITKYTTAAYPLSVMGKRSPLGRQSNVMSLNAIMNPEPTESLRTEVVPEQTRETTEHKEPILASHIGRCVREPLSLQMAIEERERIPGFHSENLRIYHGYRKGVYMLPCDEQEQDRLDFLHKALSLAMRSDVQIHVPYPVNGKVLDLGCGTGLWAINLAERNPGAFVVGVDLSPIQPSTYPWNCQFYAPFDFESSWNLGEECWDMIHLRMGCGSVVNWHSLYRKVLAHLRCGAWFEQVEIDFEPRCVDREQRWSALHYWYQTLQMATENSMRPLAHRYKETLYQLQEAGFTEINHHQIRLPLSPWHEDSHEQLVGRWYGLAFSESIEPLSLASFSRVLGWPLDKIRQLNLSAKSEALSGRSQGFHILNIYQARRPTI